MKANVPIKWQSNCSEMNASQSWIRGEKKPWGLQLICCYVRGNVPTSTLPVNPSQKDIYLCLFRALSLMRQLKKSYRVLLKVQQLFQIWKNKGQAGIQGSHRVRKHSQWRKSKWAVFATLKQISCERVRGFVHFLFLLVWSCTSVRRLCTSL